MEISQPGLLTGAVETHGPVQEPSEQRTCNPQRHRDDEAPGIATGHQELGDDADDEAEHYPRQDSHASLLER